MLKTWKHMLKENRLICTIWIQIKLCSRVRDVDKSKTKGKKIFPFSHGAVAKSDASQDAPKMFQDIYFILSDIGYDSFQNRYDAP